jgi:hypothetical protein
MTPFVSPAAAGNLLEHGRTWTLVVPPPAPDDVVFADAFDAPPA